MARDSNTCEPYFDLHLDLTRDGLASLGPSYYGLSNHGLTYDEPTYYGLTSCAARTAEVCDFGLSHTMEEAAVAAAQGTMGSPQWTAPEKLRGQRYDEKADSYSYGILLYEVLLRRVTASIT